MKTMRLLISFHRIIIAAVLISPSLKSQDPEQSVININFVNSWVRNDGFHDWLIGRSYNGSFSHGKSGAIFCEGILWGGKVYDGNDQIIRVNGADYKSGNKAITRLFRVRPDYLNADLTNDAAGFSLVNPNNVNDEMKEKILKQYEKDWKEWPGDIGAPYADANKNNRYDPEVDLPGIPSAHQTIWICYNDDSSESFADSQPTGIETQETYWAFNYTGAVGNIVFKRIKIIYNGLPSSNSNSHIDSMYIVQWADPDILTSSDDFAGCDTALNLGYAYDARSDHIYNSLNNPISAGYVFLQGVSNKTGNLLDSAVVDFKWRKAYRSVNEKPMNGFIYWAAGGHWGSPNYNYEGTLEYYNFMKGSLPYGDRFPEIIADNTSSGTYLLSGDPVEGTGKIDGKYDTPGGRRFIIVHGPFDLKLKDTVEVVIALVGGSGKSNLESITDLRRNTNAANFMYYTLVDNITNDKINIPARASGPENYVLYQNYPNPFNSSTIIKYDLPDAAFVKLVVYDVLGREVKVLVNEIKNKGNHSVEFKSDGLSSGIYIYRISFDNTSSRLVYDNLNKSCKLILIR